MILDDLVLEQYPEVKDSDYVFNGITVPRVTKILSDMLHEDSLMSWSNFIGLVKHQKYKDVLDQAADKGSLVHNGIEDYLTNDNELDLAAVPNQYQREVHNAYESFKQWWNIIATNNKAFVVMQETPLICQWYGGTLDLLLNINGDIYLFDFKTSNHLSYKYIIQLAAYRYMLKTIHNIEVAGVGIIKLNKQSVNFEEVMLHCNDPYDLDLLNHAENCFHHLVYGYYERKYIEHGFKTILTKTQEGVS